MAEGRTHVQVYIATDVIADFRNAVVKKHGTLYRKLGDELEEALRNWTKVLNGQVKK